MPAQPELVPVGSEAPDFTLASPDRDRISLSDYRGREAVVLVFMRAFG
jgi:peroxiredoxin